MLDDKSPGLDGLPAEFNKFFSPTIGRDFIETINRNKGNPSESQKRD
jgi:hypothetical protein